MDGQQEVKVTLIVIEICMDDYAPSPPHMRAHGTWFFKKGLKKVFIQLLNKIENMYYWAPLYQMFKAKRPARARAYSARS